MIRNLIQTLTSEQFNWCLPSTELSPQLMQALHQYWFVLAAASTENGFCIMQASREALG